MFGAIHMCNLKQINVMQCSAINPNFVKLIACFQHYVR